MNKVIIYFEIDGLGVDENDNPCPAGMKIEWGETKDPISYNELTKNLDIPAILKIFWLQKMINPEDVHVISPEEYEAKYGGDDEDE